MRHQMEFPKLRRRNNNDGWDLFFLCFVRVARSVNCRLAMNSLSVKATIQQNISETATSEAQVSKDKHRLYTYIFPNQKNDWGCGGMGVRGMGVGG